MPVKTQAIITRILHCTLTFPLGGYSQIAPNMIQFPSKATSPLQRPPFLLSQQLPTNPTTTTASTTDHRRDRELLDRFLATDDQEAFSTLVSHHQGMLRRVCLRVLADESEADDAVVDVLTTLAHRAGEIPTDVPVAGWLHQVAWRCARTRRLARQNRHLRERPMATLPELALTAATKPDLQAARLVLAEEMAHLPAQDRDLLQMCYQEGITRQEAAKRLGMAPGSVHRRLQRLLETLRRRLISRGVSAPVIALLLVPTASGAGEIHAGPVIRPVPATRFAPWILATGILGTLGCLIILSMRQDQSQQPQTPMTTVQAETAPLAPVQGVAAGSRIPVGLVGSPDVTVTSGMTVLDGDTVQAWTVRSSGARDGQALVTIRPQTLPTAFVLEFLVRPEGPALSTAENESTRSVVHRDDKGVRTTWNRRRISIRQLSDDAWENQIHSGSGQPFILVTRGVDRDQALRISMPKGVPGSIVVADVRVKVLEP
jgi:RNA polymerase sigma factor (sigma-70 family)